MGIADLLRRCADRIAPPQPPAVDPDIEMPDLPQGSTLLVDTTNHAQIVGQPDAHFMRREQIYTDADGAKYKVTLKNNLHAAGCNHCLTSPGDIGFISYISGKPVCKICEREYKRMRNQTRHEECQCRHLVAPHELTYIEGKGFVCEECKKEIDSLSPLKAFGWLAKLLLKPLIIEESAPGNEVTHEKNPLPPHESYPPIPYHPPTWPGYYPPNQTTHELDRGRPKGSNNPQ